MLRGDRATLCMLWLLFVLWVAMAALWPWTLGRNQLDLGAYAVMAALAVVANAAALGLVQHAPRPVPRAVGLRAHEVVVLQRLALAGAFLSATLGLLVAAAIVVPVIGVTAYARAAMRPYYDPTKAAARVIT